MKAIYSVRSHRGKIREKNEDNFLADEIFLTAEYRNKPFSIDASAFSSFVLAVCDGAGGEENGELASLTAVKKISEFQLQLQTDLNSALGQCIEEVNNEIHSTGKRSGTTLALAVISEKSSHCFNIGDSRIYLLKNNSFRRITNDHTVGAEKVRNGIMSEEYARRCEDGNKLTRCIGIGKYRSAESYPEIKGKYRLLICSDGLTDMLTDNEIAKIISENSDVSETSEKLLQVAMDKGGEDNITIIVADVSHNRFFI